MTVATFAELMLLTLSSRVTLRTESGRVMSELQQVPVDTTAFRVPTGYRVTGMRRRPQSRQRP